MGQLKPRCGCLSEIHFYIFEETPKKVYYAHTIQDDADILQISLCETRGYQCFSIFPAL